MFADIARDDIFQLETRRLWLRWPRAADAPAIARFCSQWQVARFTTRIPHPYPPGSAERFIFAARAGNAEGAQLVLTMTPRSGNRESIGSIALEARAGGHLHLSYVVAPEHWGKGLAGEAAAAMLIAGFQLSAATQIDANVFKENVAARRVLEKCGFSHLGSAPCGAPARGGLVDSDSYSIGRDAIMLRRAMSVAPGPRSAARRENRHEIS